MIKRLEMKIQKEKKNFVKNTKRGTRSIHHDGQYTYTYMIRIS